MTALLLVSALLFQATPSPTSTNKGADFAKWWAGFQAVVAKRDVGTVAQGVQFPLNWENGPIRDIKSAADLKFRFDSYFTAEIKKIVATKKPERLSTGTYSITWKARGNEYSIYFKPQGNSFALDGLSEGPP
jgi:hypothetical protein